MQPATSAIWNRQNSLYRPTRRETVFLVLSAIFLTHALLGEIIGGKLFELGGYIMSIGVIPWPIVFIATDLVNEYYGPKAVRRLTLLAVGMIVYTFVILYLCIAVTASPISPVTDAAFSNVFGQSLWIIVGSITAFALSQLIDAAIFVVAKAKTGGKLLWLRAVGSTVISQFIDTFVINTIAFGLPGKISAGKVVELSLTNYTYKFLIAICTLPFIYAGHSVLERYFHSEAQPPAEPEPEVSEQQA
jgi:hypothetical protein